VKKLARFTFWAFGVLAIAALALTLTIPSAAAGNPNLSSQMFGFAETIVAVFFIYMFAKLFLRVR
jgi:hypothetical protein